MYSNIFVALAAYISVLAFLSPLASATPAKLSSATAIDAVSCDGDVSWPVDEKSGIFKYSGVNPIFPGLKATSQNLRRCPDYVRNTDSDDGSYWALIPNSISKGRKNFILDNAKDYRVDIGDLCLPNDISDHWRCASCDQKALIEPEHNATAVWDAIEGDGGAQNLVNAWLHPDRKREMGNMTFSQFVFFAFKEDNSAEIETSARCDELDVHLCEEPASDCGKDGLSPFGLTVMNTMVRIQRAFSVTEAALRRAKDRMQNQAQYFKHFAEYYDPTVYKEKKIADLQFALSIIDMSLSVITMGQSFSFNSVSSAAMAASDAASTAAKVSKASSQIVIGPLTIASGKKVAMDFVRLWSSGTKIFATQENRRLRALSKAKLDVAEEFRAHIQVQFDFMHEMLAQKLRAFLGGHDEGYLRLFFGAAKSGKGRRVLQNLSSLEETFDSVLWAELVQKAWREMSTVHFRPFILAYPKSATYVNAPCKLNKGISHKRWHPNYNDEAACVDSLPHFTYWLMGASDHSSMQPGRKHHAFYPLPGIAAFKHGGGPGGWTLEDIVLSSVNSWWMHNCTVPTDPENYEQYLMKGCEVSRDGWARKVDNLDITETLGKKTPGLWTLPVVYSKPEGDREGIVDMEEWVDRKMTGLPKRPYGHNGNPGKNGCPAHYKWIPLELYGASYRGPR